MITVKKIPPQIVEHFDSTGKSLGFLNEYEATDLRMQISEAKAEGYYLVFEGEKIGINKYGKLESQWPGGLYDFLEIAIGRLMTAGIKHYKEDTAKK